MSDKIKHAVGKGRLKNDEADVEIVQTLLNQNGAALIVTKKADPDTIAAIIKFQAGFMLDPDGKVDPAGTTFERLQGLGLVEMPASGGIGWYRYDTGDMKKSLLMHFGTADTVQAILAVAVATNFTLPAIGVGDLSSASGGNMGRHASHLHGKNVDLRPLRQDGAGSPTNITDTANYSRDRTLALVDMLLAHRNVDKIYFNDPEIIKVRKPRVQKMRGHDNHLHVIMKS